MMHEHQKSRCNTQEINLYATPGRDPVWFVLSFMHDRACTFIHFPENIFTKCSYHENKAKRKNAWDKRAQSLTHRLQSVGISLRWPPFISCALLFAKFPSASGSNENNIQACSPHIENHGTDMQLLTSVFLYFPFWDSGVKFHCDMIFHPGHEVDQD